MAVSWRGDLCGLKQLVRDGRVKAMGKATHYRGTEHLVCDKQPKVKRKVYSYRGTEQFVWDEQSEVTSTADYLWIVSLQWQ
jgi:hypothetical protein